MENMTDEAAQTILSKVLTNMFIDVICSDNIIFDVVLTGRSGVGKTSTINTLMGHEVSKVDKYKPGTKDLMTFQHNYQGVNFYLTDTPGLCDDIPAELNNRKYLTKITDSIKKPFCLLYVTELDAARVSSDEKNSIKHINETFDKSLWHKTIIVFTGADRVLSEDFQSLVSQRGELIYEEISKYTRIDPPNFIPIIPISNVSDILPNGDMWKPTLYAGILDKLVVTPYVNQIKRNHSS
jgi:predicted GTPase